MKHSPLVAAILLFSAACASAAYWGLALFEPPARLVAAPPPAAPAPLNIEVAAGLFGGQPAGAALAAALQLKGVIEDGAEGVAILAVDGKAALAVGVGKEVAPGVMVTEIHQRYVLLSEGGAVKRLDLPDNAIAGLELVAAAAAGSTAAVPARAPVTVARSGGPMPPPVMDPNLAKTPGRMPDPVQQMQQMQQQMEHMRRMRQPAGIGPAAFGAKPTG